MPFVAIFEQFSEMRHSAGRHLLHVYAAEDANGLRCGSPPQLKLSKKQRKSLRNLCHCTTS